MASITDFKLVGDNRAITKVRVSIDGSKTWGVLFSSSNSTTNLQFELWKIWDEDASAVDEICVPNNGSATYEIGFNVYETDGEGNRGFVEEHSMYHTFNYEDYIEGTNTITIPIEYNSNTYDVIFEFDVRFEDSAITCHACGHVYDPNEWDACPRCDGEGLPENGLTIDHYEIEFEEGIGGVSDGGYRITFYMSDNETIDVWVSALDVQGFSDGTLRAYINGIYDGYNFDNYEVILN